jgi:TPR repeat protein
MKKIVTSLELLLTLSYSVTLNEDLSALEKGDYQTAKVILEELANKNNAIAQFNLGIMYANGQGVIQDKKRAKEYFGKACDGGDQKGCDNYKILNQQGY